MKIVEMVGEWGRRLRLLFSSRAQFDREMDEEMHLHRDLRAREFREMGTAADEADYVAQRKFGNTLRLREQSRAAWGWGWLERLAMDVRYGVRRLRKSPGFTLITVVTLALGIGANAAIFTLINAIFLKSLPVTRPDELWSLGDDRTSGSWGGLQGSFTVYSYPLYQYLRDHSPEFSDMAAFQSWSSSLGVRRKGSKQLSEPYYGEFVSGNYFKTFGVDAYSGRTISAEDDQPNSSPVAMMSYRLWGDRFGFDPSVVGETFFFESVPVTVIGITPPGFFGDAVRADPADFWISLNAEPFFNPGNSLLKQWNEYWLYVIGRMKPGNNPREVQAHVTAEMRQWLTENYVADRFNGDSYIVSRYQKSASQYIILMPARGGVAEARYKYAHGLWLLMAVSALVLLIACANIANLLLARSAANRVQTAIRVALGASRARVMQQVLAEGMVLALLGGAAGIWIAYQGARAVLLLGFRGAKYVPIDVHPSTPVLLFALAMTLITGIVFSVAPAWMASHTDPADPMRAGGRSSADHSLLPQKSLLILQVMLSFVLLVGAGLLTESLRHAEDQPFGFEAQGRLIAAIDLPQAQYPPERLETFYRQLQQRLQEIPGVISASFANYSPLQGRASEPVSIEGHATVPSLGETKWPGQNRVSAHYFETIGSRILRGRAIDEHDSPKSQHVAVINESFARIYFPNEDPIGSHMGIQTAEHSADYEIVGIVEDAISLDTRQPHYPMFFLPLLQEEHYSDTAEELEQQGSKYIYSIQVRVTGRPEDFRDTVRRALGELDPNLNLPTIRTYEEIVSLELNQDKLLAKLTALYGLLALVLASVGLYGVASYSVVRRTNEIGIRMALGADRRRVIAMVLHSAMNPIVLGLGIGIPVALAGGRAIASLLYGVKSYDPMIFSIAVAVLASCAVVAALVPARRAASIDPVKALRAD